MDEEEYTYIKIPYPDARDLHFKITAPISSLVISPGIGIAWATGRYHDPMFVAQLAIQQSGSVAEIVAAGAFAYRTPPRLLPDLKLSFGRSKPFSLAISAGDLPDHLDFGGVPLTSLEVKYGAGSQIVDFSYPNPQEMSRMKFTAESGLVKIENAANANAAEIRLNGDATSYRINFGGELKQNTVLHIGMTVSKVDVFISSGTAVKVTSTNPPLSSSPDDFSRADKAFWNVPAKNHREPLLTINNGASNCPLSVRVI